MSGHIFQISLLHSTINVLPHMSQQWILIRTTCSENRFVICPLAWDQYINLLCYQRAALNHTDWTTHHFQPACALFYLMSHPLYNSFSRRVTKRDSGYENMKNRELGTWNKEICFLRKREGDVTVLDKIKKRVGRLTDQQQFQNFIAGFYVIS